MCPEIPPSLASLLSGWSWGALEGTVSHSTLGTAGCLPVSWTRLTVLEEPLMQRPKAQTPAASAHWRSSTSLGTPRPQACPPAALLSAWGHSCFPCSLHSSPPPHPHPPDRHQAPSSSGLPTGLGLGAPGTPDAGWVLSEPAVSLQKQ